MRLPTHIISVIVLLLAAAGQSRAAYTEPRLALLRVTSFRSTGGSFTVKVEGSFAFPDSLQLGLPLNVLITQGTLTARFDLTGHIFAQTAGGTEQPVSGPGILSFTAREILLVLPPGFTAGSATAQVVATFDGKPLASNRLEFTL